MFCPPHTDLVFLNPLVTIPGVHTRGRAMFSQTYHSPYILDGQALLLQTDDDAMPTVAKLDIVAS